MQAVGHALPVANRVVGEPLDDLEAHRAVADMTDDDATAGRAEVDCRDSSSAHGAAYRRNAAATPESTGMCSPVVRLSSGPVSTYTASATFSGTTSRLRIVRFA